MVSMTSQSDIRVEYLVLHQVIILLWQDVHFPAPILHLPRYPLVRGSDG